MVVCVEEEVHIRVGIREGQSIRQAVEEGSLLGPTVSMTCHNTSGSRVNSDEHSKVAAIWVRGKDNPIIKGVATEQDANTTVGSKGLGGRVTILGGPKGLITPLSSPCSLLSFRAAVGFEEAQYINPSVAEVGATKRGVAEAADVVEAEANLAL